MAKSEHVDETNKKLCSYHFYVKVPLKKDYTCMYRPMELRQT